MGSVKIRSLLSTMALLIPSHFLAYNSNSERSELSGLFNARIFYIIESIDSIIESVDSISRDERDVPLAQYITNA